MNYLLKNTIPLSIFVLAQGLLFGQLHFGFGIHPMIYHLFIILLPFDTRPVVLMILAFLAGIGVDFFMNTFVVHASSTELIAYLRPGIYKRLAPRDDYELLKEPTAAEGDYAWFGNVSGVIVVIHHL